MDKIGFIVPSKEYMDKAENYIRSSSMVDNLLIDVLDQKDILGQAKKMIDQGAKAIIARGGTYHTLKDKLSVPLIKFSISTEDILSALQEASRLTGDVYLIIEEIVTFQYEKWKSILNIDLNIIRIQDIKDIKNVCRNIYERDRNAVVVGGIVTVETSKKLGMKAIFIDNRETSFLETFLQVDKLLMDAWKDSKRMKMLESILSNIDDVVIAISEEGKVEHYNRKAEELLGISKAKVMDRPVDEILPDLDFRNNPEKLNNSILRIKGRTMSLTIAPIIMDGVKVAVICTMQDTTRIQELEKKLRLKLNKKGLTARYTFDDMLTIEKSMKDLVRKSQKAAVTESTILIYGESGTGKELLSQSIHNCSHRKDSPFVAVNCAALSETLLESELFGYEEGAFTGARKGGKPGLFEMAHGGTIFLDEVNSITPNLQTKLLRVLEEKEVMRIGSDYVIPLDVRILAATNENLIDQVVNYKFRKDLFFRLNVIELKIPPLRERKKEIIPMFEVFLQDSGKESEKILELNDELKDKLLKYDWWGNVRELRNVAERYTIFQDIDNIEDLFSFDDRISNIVDDDFRINLDEMSNTIESLIIESLVEKGKTKVEIAKILGISRQALYKKMKRNIQSSQES